MIYNGVSEASKTPPGWNGWLHHTVDVAPTEEDYKPHPWENAAYAEPDRHAGGDPARRLDAEAGSAPAHRGRLRGLESRSLRRAAFIPPPLSGKAPAMDLFDSGSRDRTPRFSRPRADGAGACWRGAGRGSRSWPPERGAAPTRSAIRSPIFDGLDKITGRIISFEVAINETVQFGALQITPRVCYSRPPTEAPQTDAFAQVDEIDEQKKLKRIFSGWMFADSPGLHGIEHPIFDIWLTGCKGGTVVIHDAPTAEASAPNPDESAADRHRG